MKVHLKEVRIAFPVLFEPEKFNEEAKEKRYDATFLVVPGSENDKNIRAAIEAVAADRWQKKAPAMLESFKNNNNKYCYLDGNTKTYDGYEGMMYLSSHRYEKDGRPTVIDRKKSPLEAKDGVVYGGCYVNASVDIYAQANNYPGIRCSLLGVQFAKDGDAFSGVRAADPDEFDDLGVEEGAEDFA